MPPAVNDFVVVFISIVLQSMPFVLIGVAASALVQEYLSERAVERWMPRNPLGGIVLGSVFGFVAPVCDCGTIPLARRLSAKGVPTPAAVAFIIAAPIVNPIVLLSTAVAFQWAWPIVALRFGVALFVAISVGVAASLLGMTRPLLLPSRSHLDTPRGTTSIGHKLGSSGSGSRGGSSRYLRLRLRMPRSRWAAR